VAAAAEALAKVGSRAVDRKIVKRNFIAPWELTDQRDPPLLRKRRRGAERHQMSYLSYINTNRESWVVIAGLVTIVVLMSYLFWNGVTF
jgi:hypothetical protein